MGAVAARTRESHPPRVGARGSAGADRAGRLAGLVVLVTLLGCERDRVAYDPAYWSADPDGIGHVLDLHGIRLSTRGIEGDGRVDRVLTDFLIRNLTNDPVTLESAMLEAGDVQYAQELPGDYRPDWSRVEPGRSRSVELAFALGTPMERALGPEPSLTLSLQHGPETHRITVLYARRRADG